MTPQSAEVVLLALKAAVQSTRGDLRQRLMAFAVEHCGRGDAVAEAWRVAVCDQTMWEVAATLGMLWHLSQGERALKCHDHGCRDAAGHCCQCAGMVRAAIPKMSMALVLESVAAGGQW